MFPEITSRLKGMLDGFNSKPVSLDLKAAGGFSFDAVNVGWYARNGYPGSLFDSVRRNARMVGRGRQP